ncbi:MAG: DUF2283 domain-containing protein [Verrucomicrobia bacterium]|nr:DUF2283 domain-containing protein [Verrucomicrobiota bacterium]
MKTETRRFDVKSNRSPVVEIDSAAQAVYVRFRKAKVARTVDCGATSMHVAVDLDANGEVIGVEGVGMSEFNIEFVLKLAKVHAPEAAIAKARYIPALLSSANGIEEPALAHV